MNRIKSVFILGASSEISYSLCKKLIQQGCERFHLISRNFDGMYKLISFLESKGASVSHQINDLLDNISFDSNIVPKISYFDLYIILSGTLGHELDARVDSREASKISMVNYLGLLPWINAIVSDKRINKKGALWIFSSVAGDRGRPSNAHYGAAKSALTTYGEALISRCFKKPFNIRLIKPGYIYTRKTIKIAPKFLCIKPEKIADILINSKNKSGVEFLPFWWGIIVFIIRISPNAILSKL